MVEPRSWSDRLISMATYGALVGVALLMLFPLVYVFAVSFSTFEDVAKGGIILWPQRWDTGAYRFVLSSPVMFRSLLNSVFLATVGTLINLVLTASMAYALANKHLVWRRFFLILVLIPILFWPGIIPRYLIVRATGLIDSLWALIIPSAINAFNLIVMRNFFMSLPEELFESAELDGANHLQIFTRIVIPLSAPVLAAIGLFYAVAHWNDYFAAILYINSAEKFPIQVLLRLVVLGGATESYGAMEGLDTVPPPQYTIQMATVVIATLPILIIYPFLQRYFVKGVLTGAIKG
jgi:putative aldouronate transport system permease protein